METENRAMFRDLVSRLLKHFEMRRQSVESNWTRDILWDHGNVPLALLFAPLFVPDLVEVGDSVFISEGDPEAITSLKECVDKEEGPREKLEQHVNMVELPFVFSSRKGSEEDCALLAEFIAEAWRGRLASRFPGRTFRVWVDPPAVAGHPIVRFHELRAP
jgi:hypothetical protein